MRALSAAEILAVCDQGASQHPLDRALILLAAVSPGQTRAKLAALSIGERDRQLLELRERTFGPALDGIVSCPVCAEPVEFSFSVTDARAPQLPPGDSQLELAAEHWTWTVRRPDSRDLAAILTTSDRTLARRQLIARCTIKAQQHGADVLPQEMPDDAIELLEAQCLEADPQAAPVLDFACPACEHRVRFAFDIATYFWNELRAEARRLLREVDVLARTYGWSEPAILALSPTRREAYLELIRP